MRILRTHELVVDIFNGLLLQTDVGGSAARLHVDHGHPGTQYHHAGEDMEARHLLLQRETVLPPHHYYTKQVRAALPRRQSSLLVEVSRVAAHCYVKPEHYAYIGDKEEPRK